MAQNKPIQRSVRMTEEVVHYIDSYRGDGFSDKLENLVIDALLGEKRRVNRLKDLDDRIECATKRLLDISTDCEIITRVIRDVTSIQRQLSSISDRVEAHVSRTDAAAAKSPG